LGVTAFEKYIKCPFQFYLSEVCQLDSTSPDQDLDRASIGTRSHKIAEILTTRLNAIYGSTAFQKAECYLDKLEKFLVLNTLRISDKDDWLLAMNQLESSCHFSELHSELTQQIFCGQPGNLSSLLEQETLKRILLRFVKIEVHRIQTQSPLRTIAFVEQTISIQLAGLEIKGRIDRIDTDHEGVAHIIDYKSGARAGRPSSNSNKKSVKLSFLPATTASQLSVQGALYSIAWQERGNPVGSFSLCLLNEDPNSAFVAGEIPEGLREFYESAATSLVNGHFAPEKNPGCSYCDYKKQCPLFLIPVDEASEQTLKESQDATYP
jgi:PD-(D/E)XK nuclease superfamily